VTIDKTTAFLQALKDTIEKHAPLVRYAADPNAGYLRPRYELWCTAFEMPNHGLEMDWFDDYVDIEVSSEALALIRCRFSPSVDSDMIVVYLELLEILEVWE